MKLSQRNKNDLSALLGINSIDDLALTPNFEKTDIAGLYKTDGHLVSEVSYDGDHYFIIIEPNALTNFATIPTWLTWLIYPTNTYVKIPSVVHDALTNEWGFADSSKLKTPNGYVILRKADDDEDAILVRVTRKFADRLFRELIEEDIRHYASVNPRTANLQAAVCYAGLYLYAFFKRLY